MQNLRKDKEEVARYRARLVVGFLLEQAGVKVDSITPAQLLAAERCADLVLGIPEPNAH
jgi:hypothetical protein